MYKQATKTLLCVFRYLSFTIPAYTMLLRAVKEAETHDVSYTCTEGLRESTALTSEIFQRTVATLRLHFTSLSCLSFIENTNVCLCVLHLVVVMVWAGRSRSTDKAPFLSFRINLHNTNALEAHKI